MDNLLSVTFEAHNVERNHHRRYEIRVGRDLFGDWTVALTYGRTGQGGQEVRHTAADPEQIQRIIRQSLRRRLSAPRRLGCGYSVTAVASSAEIDVGFWFPAESLSCFR